MQIIFSYYELRCLARKTYMFAQNVIHLVIVIILTVSQMVRGSMVPCNISEFSGSTAAIDASHWLHKGYLYIFSPTQRTWEQGLE